VLTDAQAATLDRLTTTAELLLARAHADDPTGPARHRHPTAAARLRAWWLRAFPPPVRATPAHYAAAAAAARAAGRHLEPLGLWHRAHQLAARTTTPAGRTTR